MRITIKPTTCFSSCLSSKPEENSASIIDIMNQGISSGLQGTIYELTHIDNKSISGLLVKIFNNEFPDNLKEILIAVRDNKDQYKIGHCTALKALPLFLFEGILNGTSICGYVMRRVHGKTFKSISENNTDLNTYINLPLEDRLQLCLQFVEGMDILHRLTIIHADINGHNLMIDEKNISLVIIDLDGGAVAKNGSVPIVAGKAESGWLDPEIREAQLRSTSNQAINVKISADLWSIACGIHHLLFGFAPYFFISEYPEIPRYLQYKWPQLSGLKGIKTANSSAYDYYERAYKKVPELHRCFELSFNGLFSQVCG